MNIYGDQDDRDMEVVLSDFVYIAAAGAIYLIGLLIFNIWKPKKKEQ